MKNEHPNDGKLIRIQYLDKNGQKNQITTTDIYGVPTMALIMRYDAINGTVHSDWVDQILYVGKEEYFH